MPPPSFTANSSLVGPQTNHLVVSTAGCVRLVNGNGVKIYGRLVHRTHAKFRIRYICGVGLSLVLGPTVIVNLNIVERSQSIHTNRSIAHFSQSLDLFTLLR